MAPPFIYGVIRRHFSSERSSERASLELGISENEVLPVLVPPGACVRGATRGSHGTDHRISAATECELIESHCCQFPHAADYRIFRQVLARRGNSLISEPRGGIEGTPNLSSTARHIPATELRGAQLANLPWSAARSAARQSVSLRTLSSRSSRSRTVGS